MYGIFIIFTNIYPKNNPVVNVYITMENHHVVFLLIGKPSISMGNVPPINGPFSNIAN
jgi:hypothetical protein